MCYICKEKCEDKHAKNKNYWKVSNHCHYSREYRDAAQGIYSVKYSIPKVFHNGSNYVYHFMIKLLAEEFQRYFTCLQPSTEKYITFSVPLEKEVRRIDKKGIEITKTISYRLQFIDSATIMATLLSNLVNNLAEEVHTMKCKFLLMILLKKFIK